MGKDETADLLASIAAQAYGAIAAAEEAGREIESLASVLLAPLAATPSHHACVAAMTVDPGLLALRPDEAGVKASLMLLSGGGSEIDLTKLPLALVNAAAEALVHHGANSLWY